MKSLLLFLAIVSACNSFIVNDNTSLITVKEFRELMDLISEEKQLRHALEHEVGTLRQQLAVDDAGYKSLQRNYANLSKAYNDLQSSNAQLVRKYSDFVNTNGSIQTSLSTSHADILELKQKTGSVSAFTAWSPSSSSVTEPIRFATVLSNIGSDYNPSSGNFTCQYPGVYMFTLNLYKYPSTSYSYVRCYIRRNGSNTVRAYVDPYSSADGYYYEASNSVVLHLNRGDVVSIGGCSGYIYTYSSFTGFLLKAD